MRNSSSSFDIFNPATSTPRKKKLLLLSHERYKDNRRLIRGGREEGLNERGKAKKGRKGGRNNESPNTDLANFTELYNSDVN